MTIGFAFVGKQCFLITSSCRRLLKSMDQLKFGTKFSLLIKFTQCWGCTTLFIATWCKNGCSDFLRLFTFVPSLNLGWSDLGKSFTLLFLYCPKKKQKRQDVIIDKKVSFDLQMNYNYTSFGFKFIGFEIHYLVEPTIPSLSLSSWASKFLRKIRPEILQHVCDEIS